MPVIDENAHADTFTKAVAFEDVPLSAEFLENGQLWRKIGRTRAEKVEWPGKGNTRPVRPRLVVRVAPD